MIGERTLIRSKKSRMISVCVAQLDVYARLIYEQTSN